MKNIFFGKLSPTYRQRLRFRHVPARRQRYAGPESGQQQQSRLGNGNVDGGQLPEHLVVGQPGIVHYEALGVAQGEAERVQQVHGGGLGARHGRLPVLVALRHQHLRDDVLSGGFNGISTQVGQSGA